MAYGTWLQRSDILRSEKMITKKEAAVIEIYTGVCMLVGDDRKYIYQYVSELMGRDVYTHELAELSDILKEKSKADFIKICENIK